MNAGSRRLGALVVASLAAASSWGASPAPSAPPAPKQKSFDSAENAARALVSAAETFDVEALKQILGPDGIDLVVTEDRVQDKNQSAAFAALAKEKMKVVKSPSTGTSATLIVGHDDWPMPIPIVEKGGHWIFDSKAGRQEVLYRRIGRNELDAIDVCHGFVEAQQDYALEKHDGAKVNQYAQRIISTPEKHDGLAWQAADGTWEGPVGEGVARVIAEGYTDRYLPFHGYYFKVLKSQGPSAPMGAMDYVIEGAMIGGFALAATPADYRVSGVKTFIVNQSGQVYEKDLGPEGVDAFRKMEAYDPDPSWHKVKEH